MWRQQQQRHQPQHFLRLKAIDVNHNAVRMQTLNHFKLKNLHKIGRLKSELVINKKIW